MGHLVSAVIAAAGKGERAGLNLPKQYAEAAGGPLVRHTLRAFEDSLKIYEIIVVAAAEHMDRMRGITAGFGKVKDVVEGGSDRFGSVYEGLKKTDPACGVILIHDGARPFVNESDIARVIEGVLKYGACAQGVAPAETVKILGTGDTPAQTLDRERIRLVQTPQGFMREIIMDAYGRALAQGLRATDDTTLAERAGHPVHLAEGRYENLKVTTKEDVLAADLLLRLRGSGGS